MFNSDNVKVQHCMYKLPTTSKIALLFCPEEEDSKFEILSWSPINNTNTITSKSQNLDLDISNLRSWGGRGRE